jgi:16S rRNA (guanine527-N7)-methyltransferase
MPCSEVFPRVTSVTGSGGPSKPDEDLAEYAELVRRWSRRLSLVSRDDLEHFEERHLKDSLRAVSLVDSLPDGPAVDVGSGAGLPGIPLAIAARRREWRLLEPRRKRAAFLEECVRHLQLSCEVLALSAEQAAKDPRLRRAHACAVARALAPPARAFSLMRPLLAPEGASVLFVGPDAALPPEAGRWGEGLAIMRARGVEATAEVLEEDGN